MEEYPVSSIPLRLRPVVTQTRNVFIFVYSNLAHASLSVEEREWLVREASGQNPQHMDQTTSKKGLIRRYNLYSSFFKKNSTVYKKKGSLNSVGRPPLIDDEHMSNVASVLVKRRREVDEVPKEEFRRLLAEAVVETERSRGRVDPCFERLDERTEARYREKYHIQESKSQAVTKARVDACKCPMMSYVWYLICVALGNDLPSHRKWNADATTFVFEPCGSGGKTVRLADEEEYKYVDNYEVVLKHPQPGKCKTKSCPTGVCNKSHANDKCCGRKLRICMHNRRQANATRNVARRGSAWSIDGFAYWGKGIFVFYTYTLWDCWYVA